MEGARAFPRHELLYLVADYLERCVGFSASTMDAIHKELESEKYFPLVTQWDGTRCRATVPSMRGQLHDVGPEYLESLVAHGRPKLKTLFKVQPASSALGQDTDQRKPFSGKKLYSTDVDASWQQTEMLNKQYAANHFVTLHRARLGLETIRTKNSRRRREQVQSYRQLKTLKAVQGHLAFVYCLAVSPNSRCIVTGSDDHQVKLWSSTTAQLIHTYRGHTNHVCDVTFNPSGNLIATGSDDNTVRLWDVATPRCLYVFQGHVAGIERVVFDPMDCNLISSSNDGSCGVWNVKLALESIGIKLDRSEHGNWQLDYRSNDTSLFAASGPVKAIVLPHFTTKRTPLEINCIAVHPQGGITASGAKDGLVRLWITSTEMPRDEDNYTPVNDTPASYRIQHQQPVTESQITGSRRLFRVLRGQDASITHLSWSCDGEQLLSGSSSGSSVFVYFVPRKSVVPIKTHIVSSTNPIMQSLQRLPFYGNRVEHVELKTISISARSQGPGKPPKLQTVAASMDYCFWNRDSTRVITCQSLRRHRVLPNTIQGTEFWDQQVKVWDAVSGKLLHTLRGHRNKSFIGQAHPNNPDLVVTASKDGMLIVWDIQAGKAISTLLATAAEGVAMALDVQWIPSARSSCDLVYSDSIGRISFAGTGSREMYSLAYPQQFFQTDFEDITLDAFSNVVITSTQLPPHRSPRGMICNIAKQPYALQPPPTDTHMLVPHSATTCTNQLSGSTSGTSGEYIASQMLRSSMIAEAEAESDRLMRVSLSLVTPSYEKHDAALELQAKEINGAIQAVMKAGPLPDHLREALGIPAPVTTPAVEPATGSQESNAKQRSVTQKQRSNHNSRNSSSPSDRPDSGGQKSRTRPSDNHVQTTTGVSSNGAIASQRGSGSTGAVAAMIPESLEATVSRTPNTTQMSTTHAPLLSGSQASSSHAPVSTGSQASSSHAPVSTGFQASGSHAPVSTGSQASSSHAPVSSGTQSSSSGFQQTQYPAQVASGSHSENPSVQTQPGEYGTYGARPSRRAARKALVKVKQVIGKEVEEAAMTRQIDVANGTHREPIPTFTMEDGDWVVGDEYEDEMMELRNDIASLTGKSNTRTRASSTSSKPKGNTRSPKHRTIRPTHYALNPKSSPPSSRASGSKTIPPSSHTSNPQRQTLTDVQFKVGDALPVSEEFFYPQIGDEVVYFLHGHRAELMKLHQSSTKHTELPLDLGDIPAVLCRINSAKTKQLVDGTYSVTWEMCITRVPFGTALLRITAQGGSSLLPTERWHQLKIAQDGSCKLPSGRELPKFARFQIGWKSTLKGPSYLVPRIQYDQSILESWTTGDVMIVDQSVHGQPTPHWFPYKVIQLAPTTPLTEVYGSQSPWNCLQVIPLGNRGGGSNEQVSVLFHYWTGRNKKKVEKGVLCRPPRELVLSKALSWKKRQKLCAKLCTFFSTLPSEWTKEFVEMVTNHDSGNITFQISPSLIYRRLASEYYRSVEAFRHDLEVFKDEVVQQWPHQPKALELAKNLINCVFHAHRGGSTKRAGQVDRVHSSDVPTTNAKRAKLEKQKVPSKVVRNSAQSLPQLARLGNPVPTGPGSASRSNEEELQQHFLPLNEQRQMNIVPLHSRQQNNNTVTKSHVSQWKKDIENHAKLVATIDSQYEQDSLLSLIPLNDRNGAHQTTYYPPSLKPIQHQAHDGSATGNGFRQDSKLERECRNSRLASGQRNRSTVGTTFPSSMVHTTPQANFYREPEDGVDKQPNSHVHGGLVSGRSTIAPGMHTMSSQLQLRQHQHPLQQPRVGIPPVGARVNRGAGNIELGTTGSNQPVCQISPLSPPEYHSGQQSRHVGQQSMPQYAASQQQFQYRESSSQQSRQQQLYQAAQKQAAELTYSPGQQHSTMQYSVEQQHSAGQFPMEHAPLYPPRQATPSQYRSGQQQPAHSQYPSGPQQQASQYPVGLPQQASQYPAGPPQQASQYPAGPPQQASQYPAGPPQQASQYPAGPPQQATPFQFGIQQEQQTFTQTHTQATPPYTEQKQSL